MRKQYTDCIVRIQTILDKWEPLLGLIPWYEAQHRFIDAERAEDKETAAVTEAKWHYRIYNIEWYLPNLAVMDPDQLEDTVVHELVHVLICPLDVPLEGPKHVPLVELATETITRALIKAERFRE